MTSFVIGATESKVKLKEEINGNALFHSVPSTPTDRKCSHDKGLHKYMARTSNLVSVVKSQGWRVKTLTKQKMAKTQPIWHHYLSGLYFELLYEQFRSVSVFCKFLKSLVL